MKQIVVVVRRASVAAILVAAVGVASEPAGGKFDGAWQAKAVPMGAGQCRALTRDAKITNDTFNLLWNSRSSVYITGTVDNTGMLPLSDGTVGKVTGALRYDGNKFVGEVKDLSAKSYCSFNVELTKK
jgi:hypothetical protein